MSDRLTRSFRSHLKLYDNYPNPFNPTTKIKFDVANNLNSNISLTIYDSNGKEVEKLVDGSLAPGTYEIDWPAGDASNLASGSYFYKLETNDFSETKVMILIK